MNSRICCCLVVLVGLCTTAAYSQEIKGLGRPWTQDELDAATIHPLQVEFCPGVDLLVSLCTGDDACEGSAYGFFDWDNMTAAIDAAAASVTTTTDLEDLSSLLGFDALWIDHRGYDGSGPDYLSAAEIANIEAFIDTGRRVVMIGENSAWTTWNNQLMDIVGGTFTGQDCSSTTSSVAYSHPITDGITSVRPVCVGLASGGTPLLTVPFVTLWGPSDNVVTILDENAEADGAWGDQDNGQFFTHVAEWVGCEAPAVPSTQRTGLVVLALLVLLLGASTLAVRVRASRRT